MNESTPNEAKSGTPVPDGAGMAGASGSPTDWTRLLDQLPCPCQSLDVNGRILQVNEAWLQRLDYTREEVVGHPFTEFMADHHAVTFPQRFREFQRTGKTAGGRYDLIARNGACLPFLVDGQIEHGPGGGMVCTHCVLHDASEHARLAGSLCRSESRFRSTLASLHEGALMIDTQQQIILASPPAGTLLGEPPEQLRGRLLHDLLDESSRVVARNLLAQLAKEEDHHPTADLRFRRKDGSLVLTRTRMGAVLDEQHRALATVVLLQEIGEQARIERELRERQELCHVLLDGSQDGILICESANRVIHANRRAAEMHGVSEEELLALAPRDFMPRESFRRFQECLAAVDRGEEFSARVSGRHADRSTFPAVAYGCGVNLGGRRHYYYSLHDVSRMEEAELARHESEVLYRQIFQSMADGVAIYEVVDDGADFRFRDLNPVGCRHAGLSREEIVGRSIREVFPSVGEMGLLEVFRQVWRTREPRHHPLCHYLDDRLSLWVENYVCVLPSDELVAVYRDVTEQRQRESELREGESRLRHLLQNMPVLLDAFDAHGDIVVWNRECERVTGYSSAEVVGNPQALSWMYPDPDVRRQRLDLQAPGGGGFRDREWTLRCKDGSYRTLLLSNISAEFPVPGWDSWATGLDITVYRESQREVTARQEELEERVRERTEELRAMVDAMAGREIRMAELKEIIRTLRNQLHRAGLQPVADDPLAEEEEE